MVHGALDFAELEQLGLAPQAVLDFSVNGNPYGPSPRLWETLSRVPVDRYPDREALTLRRALSRDLEVEIERIMVGNGSIELVWLVALAFVRSGDVVLILDPTFGEYRRAAMLMGAQIHTCTATSHAAFCPDLEAILTALQRLAPRVVFLCNPNNPTGTFLQVETIMAWAAARPTTLFVVDEAYLTFAVGAPSMLQEQPDNVLVLRSMTKAYALAGVRLGYAVGHPDVLNLLHKVRPPWSVNALAQAAGVVALTDTAHIASSLSHVVQAKQQLVQDLSHVGLQPVSSCTHFFLLRVGDAAACRRALLQRGILVRDCTSFGLPAYIRVATRRPEENARLLAALVETRAWYDSC